MPRVQFLDRMVDIPVELRLQWQKTAEVPQLPFLGRACSVRQWIHILRQRGRLLEYFLVFYRDGWTRLLRSILVPLFFFMAAHVVDHGSGMFLTGFPGDDAPRAVFQTFAF